MIEAGFAQCGMACHREDALVSSKGSNEREYQMVTELYSRYGSRLTSGTSEMLYDALLADEVLAPFFVNIDMDSLREHMADLISSLTGGPEIYSGRSMADAHAPFQITAYHFQRVASHLETSLLAAGISQEDADLVLAEVGKVRGAVVNS